MGFFSYLCRPNVICVRRMPVRRYIFIVSLALCSVLANAFTRLTPETAHFVSLHGDAGYSALLHNVPDLPPSAGMSTMIGVDYRLFHNNFIFSAGVEGMYELNVNRMDELDVTIPMMDTEGELFNMHVLVDKSTDLAHMVNLNIPILFGGEWGRFYFMVGPKVSLNFYGSTSSKAQITTYGEYDRAYDDFYDMLNHGFVSNQYMGSASVPLKWNMNILAHMEIGGRIGHMFKHKQFRLNPDKIRMYVAAYADFGVLNLHTGTNGEPVFGWRETEEGVQFFSQPLMNSTLSNGATFRNLNVGIKFTVAFEMPKHGKSFLYDEYQSERDYRKRGGNQGYKNGK